MDNVIARREAAVLLTDFYEVAHAADPNVVGAAILAPERAIEPQWHVIERADGTKVRLDTADGNAPAQAAVTAVEVLDASAPAEAARTTARVRAVAQQLAAEQNAVQAVVRAVLLVAVDELNALRQWVTSFKAEVAAATSHADLKARVAALPNLPDRTAVQAKNAVLSKIDGGGAD